MMVKIKLCGLSRPEDIAEANALMPDYIGFVFARKSKRYVPPEEAARLRALLDPGIAAVGVFVNAPEAQVAALLNSGTIQAAQLHCSEDAAYIRRLRALTDGELWQAFRVSGPEDLARAAASEADRILLDNGPGGTGERFDWGLLAGFTARPFLLAGGLYPENVREAVQAVRPWGVDVSSGIESDGRKDPEKMRAFVKAVREAEL